MDYASFMFDGNDIEPSGNNISVHAGFPNAATDATSIPLSLDRLLIQQPISTFLFRLQGTALEEAGIFEGDIAVINRALDPRDGDLIIAWHEDGFRIDHKRAMPKTAVFWGVVTSIIHEYR